MRRAFLSRLRADPRGATLVEFAIISPVMLIMLMGLGDMIYQAYAQAILNGAIQKAARDSGIEGASANLTTIDGQVIAMIANIVKNPTQNCGTGTGNAATWCSTRESYDTFTEVAPEPFVDANHNGVYDKGECFTDVNGNGVWDADPGKTGQGGASAVTLYKMTVTYPRLFPVAALLGWSKMQTISASTLLKNQPYATQTTTANVQVNCS
jgi:Flp pilus assembly protein TadG